jgi:hypothetical protein
MHLRTQCQEITGITSSAQGQETIVVSFQFHLIVAVEVMHATSLHAAISFFWGLDFAVLQPTTHESKACVPHSSTS